MTLWFVYITVVTVKSIIDDHRNLEKCIECINRNNIINTVKLTLYRIDAFVVLMFSQVCCYYITIVVATNKFHRIKYLCKTFI